MWFFHREMHNAHNAKLVINQAKVKNSEKDLEKSGVILGISEVCSISFNLVWKILNSTCKTYIFIFCLEIIMYSFQACHKYL